MSKASGTRRSNAATGAPPTPARPEFNSGCGRRCLCGKALRGDAGGHLAFGGDRELPVTQGRESASVASLLKRPRARRARFKARLRQWGCRFNAPIHRAWPLRGAAVSNAQTAVAHPGNQGLAGARKAFLPKKTHGPTSAMRPCHARFSEARCAVWRCSI